MSARSRTATSTTRRTSPAPTPTARSTTATTNQTTRSGKRAWSGSTRRCCAGQKGGSYFEHDAHGVLIRELTGGAPAVDGKNLQLTIDLELQAAVSRAVKQAVERSTAERRAAGQERANCRGGAVVMLSPKTGEVFSLVSYPDYDNQLFIDGLSILKAREYGLVPDEEAEKARKEALERNEEPVYDGVTDPLTDRAYVGAYEPGSTIKLFMAIAGLREKVIDDKKQFECTGGIGIPLTTNLADRNVYLCWKHKDGQSHGAMDVVSAIEQSCDVYFYNVGTPKQRLEDGTNLIYRDYFFANDDLGDRHEFDGLGIDKIDRHMRKRFWFGQQTGIDLPAEATGLVPTPEWKTEVIKDGWAAGDTIITSIGQGYFQASPLQMAVNTATLANGGRVMQPRVVRSVVGDDGKEEVQVFEKQQQRRIKFNSGQLDLVREGMRRVVHAEMGTAHRNADQSSKWPLTNPEGEEEILIAGKTGTAEVGRKDPETGEYSDAHAWFTCFAPFDKPEVVVTVFLERGGEGATYAVPVADAAMRAYFELTGKRNRGLVLRRDGEPIDEESPAPADAPEENAEATPAAEPAQ